MLPKKKKAPGGARQQRRYQIISGALNRARATREARRGEEQQLPAQRIEPDVEMSQAGGDRDVQMSQAGTSRDPEPVVQPITADDLVAVITGVLQAQQQ